MEIRVYMMGNFIKKFHFTFCVLFLLALFITLTAAGLLSCAAETPEASDAFAEMDIAERMKNLIESEQAEQTTISTTEIISNTLPYDYHAEPESEIETEEITATTETITTAIISETSEISEIIETSENIAELYVITPSGKKYHYQHCRTVKNIKEHLSKEEAEQQGYDACKICNPK